MNASSNVTPVQAGCSVAAVMSAFAELIAAGAGLTVAHAILKPLMEAVAPRIVGVTSTFLEDRWKNHHETRNLSAPQDLPNLITSGQAKPGDFVKGTGFFSLHTIAYPAPEPQLNNLLGGMMGMIASMQSGSPVGRPIAHVHPSSKYAVLSSTARVGFIYPHRMSGFTIAMGGGAAGMPWLGRQILLVPKNS